MMKRTTLFRSVLLLGLLWIGRGSSQPVLIDPEETAASHQVLLPEKQAPLCQRLHDPGAEYHAAYLCAGVPNWALVPALWTPLSVQVNCSTPAVSLRRHAQAQRVHASGGQHTDRQHTDTALLPTHTT